MLRAKLEKAAMAEEVRGDAAHEKKAEEGDQLIWAWVE